MSEVSTIGLDIAKNVSTRMAWMRGLSRRRGIGGKALAANLSAARAFILSTQILSGRRRACSSFRGR